MSGVRRLRLAVVDGKGAKHPAVLRRDGRGPAGSQAERQSQIAVVGPQRVGRDIGHDDRLLPINGGAARSHARPYLRSVNGPCVFLGKTGGSAVAQSYAVSVQKKNGTQHSAVLLLNFGA